MTPAVLLLTVAMLDEGSPAAPEAAQSQLQSQPQSELPPNIVVPAVHALAMMSVMRVTETILWPEPFARPEQFAGRYETAFTSPPVFDPKKPVMQWDGDPWAVNAIGHGLFGSELYLRARQCRFGWAGSLAFTAASSVIWEYGFEANGARPSALDLVYTPLIGVALGEVRFIVHRAASGLSSGAGRGIVRAVVDPLGEFERGALNTGC